MPRKYRANQLVWLGEFVARVTAVDADGNVLSLQGGPVLGDGDFNADRLRPLGIAGMIHVAMDYVVSDGPRWARLLVIRRECPQCRRWVEKTPCPHCDCYSFRPAGICNAWVRLQMKLWLFGSSKYGNGRPWAVRQINSLGRWLWCNEWKA